MAATPKPVRARRKWIFRLILALTPLMGLGMLELGLRLGGYGYDTGFFKPMQAGGAEMLVENDNYGFRFFPREVARVPRPIMIEARKPADVRRIFIFGESAAEGDPDPAYGAARFMEVLLHDRFPQTRFEIVNVAITAINSHGIVPIARECARREGDIWIIYMGNNEMIGPFGATGAFGPPAPPLALIRASLAIQRTRLGQLLKSGASYLANRGTAASTWGGLDMFAQHHISPQDPAKTRVYRNFQANLKDILQAGLDSGAKIILNTVAVNLEDCPPLASEHTTTLSPDGRANWERLVAEAKAAQDQGNAARAAQSLEAAAAIDPQFAEVQYQWGQCLLQMTNFNSARAHYQLACDYDAMPVRTDARINGIIRQAAQLFTGGNLALLDAPSVLTTNSVTGVCGSETFYEHVHFNPKGSYLLGRAWAEQVEAFMPADTRRQTTEPWASQSQCERRLAMTDWNRRNDLTEIIARRRTPPLNGQSNNAQQLAQLQAELAALNRRMDADGAAQARQICLQAIQQDPQDMDIRCNFADFLEAIGRAGEAAEQWRQVQQIRPGYYLGYFQEGRMLERLGDLEGARAAFLHATALRPVMAPAWFELSNIAASSGDTGAALQEVQRASQLQPHNPVYHACMGKLLSRLNLHARALDCFRQAVQVDPGYLDGHLALGRELGALGNWSAAQAEFEHVLQLDPANPQAQASLSQLHAQSGH